MSEVIDLADRRLAYDLVATLRNSTHHCNLCERPWCTHSDAKIIDHSIELSRRKAAEMASYRNPPVSAERLERVVAVIAETLPAYGLPGNAARAAARGVMLALAREEMIR